MIAGQDLSVKSSQDPLATIGSPHLDLASLYGLPSSLHLVPQNGEIVLLDLLSPRPLRKKPHLLSPNQFHMLLNILSLYGLRKQPHPVPQNRIFRLPDVLPWYSLHKLSLLMLTGAPAASRPMTFKPVSTAELADGIGPSRRILLTTK